MIDIQDLDAYIEHQEYFKERAAANGHVAPTPGSEEKFADLVACELKAEHPALFDDAMNES